MFAFNVLKLLREKVGPCLSPAPRRPKPPVYAKPSLEGLEKRECPANTDTLVWNPAAGSQDAALATNWFDQTQNKQGVLAPTATNPIVLDGIKANQPIEFTANMSAASLTVQNGYKNTLILDASIDLETSATDTIKSGSTLSIRPTTNFATGIWLANNSGFTVASGATLNLVDPPGATSGVTFLVAVDGTSGEYLNNAGLVTWTGTKVAQGKSQVEDNIVAPILNTGSFILNGGTGGDSSVLPGTLTVTGQDENNTNDVSFYQTDGSCSLTGNAQMYCVSGYKQTGGSLSSDASTCLLVGGSALGTGDINIAGGKVVVDNVANSIGTFQFSAATAEINGEIDVSGLAQGGDSTTADLLDCTGVGTVTLQANSVLNVGIVGNQPLGTGNQWVVMKYAMGARKNNWNETQAPPGMQVSTGPTQVLVSN